MKKANIVLTALAFACATSTGFAEAAAVAASSSTSMDCSNMSMDMQQFAAQLSMANKRMFCGQFSDAQRSAAMQYVGKPDASGNMMNANQAVQKVAADNNMTPSTQKSPTGCPVK